MIFPESQGRYGPSTESETSMESSQALSASSLTPYGPSTTGLFRFQILDSRGNLSSSPDYWTNESPLRNSELPVRQYVQNTWFQKDM